MRGKGSIYLVVTLNIVDPQFERHPSGKLVPFTPSGNVVGVNLALDVDVFILSGVKELDGNQRLRIVHLKGKENHLN